MAKLYFRYGTMNSGKSIEVLKTAHNYEEQGKKKVLLFTSSLDDRYGIGVVASRIGIQKDAVMINDSTDLYAMVLEQNPNCVLVDEVQFFAQKNRWSSLRKSWTF